MTWILWNWIHWSAMFSTIRIIMNRCEFRWSALAGYLNFLFQNHRNRTCGWKKTWALLLRSSIGYSGSCTAPWRSWSDHGIHGKQWFPPLLSPPRVPLMWETLGGSVVEGAIGRHRLFGSIPPPRQTFFHFFAFISDEILVIFHSN